MAAETIQTTEDEFVDFVKRSVKAVEPQGLRKHSMVKGVGRFAVNGANGLLPVDEAMFSVRTSAYMDGSDVHSVKLLYKGLTERMITHTLEEGFTVWWSSERYMTDESAETYAAHVLREMENLVDAGKMVPHLELPVRGAYDYESFNVF